MTHAKNYKNWWMCIKVIASQTWEIEDIRKSATGINFSTSSL